MSRHKLFCVVWAITTIIIIIVIINTLTCKLELCLLCRICWTFSPEPPWQSQGLKVSIQGYCKNLAVAVSIGMPHSDCQYRAQPKVIINTIACDHAGPCACIHSQSDNVPLRVRLFVLYVNHRLDLLWHNYPVDQELRGSFPTVAARGQRCQARLTTWQYF